MASDNNGYNTVKYAGCTQYLLKKTDLAIIR